MFRSDIELSNIPTPDMVALIVGAGTGSKLLQSHLDNHPDIYMIPAYPLMYFYPHWQSWRDELGDSWNWPAIVDEFCKRHASVIDSRRIPGHNGLTRLGQNRNQYISIDEAEFKAYILRLLQNQEITSRNFLLAVHIAYALCKREDVFMKRVLVYHIHLWEYFATYLIRDFPESKLITMTRDHRPSMERRVQAFWKVDQAKLNETDALIYHSRAYYNQLRYGNLIYQTYDFKKCSSGASFASDRIVAVKHEDLGTDLCATMNRVGRFLDVEFRQEMLQISFDGKAWWSDKVYATADTQTFNPEILSTRWQTRIDRLDWFVLEGVFLDYFRKYEYQVFRYTEDTVKNLFKLALGILIPSKTERQIALKYCTPSFHGHFLKVAWMEACGQRVLKDYRLNAAYRYKYTYRRFGLYKRRFPERIVSLVRKVEAQAWPLKCFAGPLCALYVAYHYLRLLVSIAGFPLLIVKSRMLFYKSVYSRLVQKNFHPDYIKKQLNEVIEEFVV